MPKIVVVLPAYNAELTLRETLSEIPEGLADEIILVDDASRDGTVDLARSLGLRVIVHSENRGYGGNQKTCYNEAMRLNADIVVMLHPDLQYHPSYLSKLVQPLVEGSADASFGSRMIERKNALEGGMPLYKFIANIMLTNIENVCLGAHFTEYHSGLRAYTREYLDAVNYNENSDGFIFDNEIIIQGFHKRFIIHEISIRARYFDEASSISLVPSVLYGLRILKRIASYKLHQWGIRKSSRYE